MATKRKSYNPDGLPVMSAIFVAGIVVCGSILYTKNRPRIEKSILVIEPTKRENKDGSLLERGQ